VKGGREEVWPLLKDVKEAIECYLKLDRRRREIAHSGGEDAHLFQPHTNYRTLDFDKPLSTRMVQKNVKRWADYPRIGDLSPHDLRRTAITRALDSGLTYRQVQMMSKHKDPKTVMRYDHGRENLEQNTVNFLARLCTFLRKARTTSRALWFLQSMMLTRLWLFPHQRGVSDV
jgi:integrase